MVDIYRSHQPSTGSTDNYLETVKHDICTAPNRFHLDSLFVSERFQNIPAARILLINLISFNQSDTSIIFCTSAKHIIRNRDPVHKMSTITFQLKLPRMNNSLFMLEAYFTALLVSLSWVLLVFHFC